ncbi:hypothetical protein A2U01_0068823, partial [Trifolium medium]|nr:hypothetical protein [Trifolium medium]
IAKNAIVGTAKTLWRHFLTAIHGRYHHYSQRHFTGLWCGSGELLRYTIGALLTT